METVINPRGKVFRFIIYPFEIIHRLRRQSRQDVFGREKQYFDADGISSPDHRLDMEFRVAVCSHADEFCGGSYSREIKG